MTIQELVQGARHRLLQAGISDGLASLDAELLARQVLGWDKARFLADSREPASSAFLLNYEHCIARRMRREPVSYIIGSREFWSLDFEVTPDVLIPRPETELIIEEALQQTRSNPRPLFYDIGTGSGILAVALAKECPGARIVATDISARALEVARRNAARHGVAGRITFVETSFMDGLDERADLIVSNPPYVPSPFAAGLSPEVRDYEPTVAVFGGADGLDGVRRVIEQAAERLLPDGWLIMEFGYGQDDAVAGLIDASSALSLVKIRCDLQEIPRTVVAKRNP